VGDGNTKVNKLNYFYEGTTLFDLEYICKNKVPSSIDVDGTIYNGTGYKNGYRVRSGGGESSHGWTSCTGYIAVQPGDIIRLNGWDFNTIDIANAINVYDKDFNCLGQFTRQPASYGIFASWETGGAEAYGNNSVSQEQNGIWAWTVPPKEFGVAYIRVSGYTKAHGEIMLVSINTTIDALFINEALLANEE
jgi:hypothetical protein